MLELCACQAWRVIDPAWHATVVVVFISTARRQSIISRHIVVDRVGLHASPFNACQFRWACTHAMTSLHRHIAVLFFDCCNSPWRTTPVHYYLQYLYDRFAHFSSAPAVAITLHVQSSRQYHPDVHDNCLLDLSGVHATIRPSRPLLRQSVHESPIIDITTESIVITIVVSRSVHGGSTPG